MDLMFDTDSDDQCSKKRKVLLACTAIAVAANMPEVHSFSRISSTLRDREAVVQKMDSLPDRSFKMHYRLSRPCFESLLQQVAPLLEPNDEGRRMAAISAGSFVPAKIMLAVTLRLLSGGSYLDIAFGYNVAETFVFKIFNKVILAMDKVLNNVEFPYESETDLMKLESGFRRVSKGYFPGTVLAGDGIVIRMIKPTDEEVDGNVRSFFTRKGFYAIGLQAFCDADCRFRHLSMKTCSSTHDGTAYELSGLNHIIREGKLPDGFHVVLDEAYSCTEQELSPWKGKHLSQEKDAFNYFLSLHRQVIERAFGMLVRRWGILWRPLRFGVQKNNLIIQVCCKLHNLCIDALGASSASFEVAPQDVQWRRGRATPADTTVLWTDGVPVRQGTRTDLAESTTRDKLTRALFMRGASRPAHSVALKVQRLKDVDQTKRK